MGIDIAQVETLVADLAKAGPGAVERTKVAIRKTALDIERNAKTIAPVDTGNLKNSIGHSDMRMMSASSMVVEVGPTANYGKFVEFGTSRMAPQAFMGPSLDRFAGPFEQAMEQIGAEAFLNGG